MEFLKVLIEQVILYIRFRIRARHRQGRGVHPPFAFRFIHEAIFGKDPPGLERIGNLRRELLKNRKILKVSDLGAGSRTGAGEMRSIRKLVKHTAVSTKTGCLLARIAKYLNFSHIIELGCGTGISSLYMGIACPRSRVLSCEGAADIAALARENIRQLGVSNIEVYNDVFADWLPRVLNQNVTEVFVFIDGDHRGERLQQYCASIIESGLLRVVLVLDDIHWSKDMNVAWKRLLKRSEISLSMELYNTGIIFLGCGIQQGHFVVNF